MKHILKYLLAIYQNCLSPFLGDCCRFYPSCSSYAKEALDKYPLKKSLLMIVKRILKCSAFSKGGIDLP
ncbi:MAG: membrane protein insertion efficiency factor YidD [Rhabdochlamydiaceae bacterium]